MVQLIYPLSKVVHRDVMLQRNDFILVCFILFYYVFRQSRSTMATQDIGETINATNVIEGVSPHWNEMIYADILEESNHSEGKSTNKNLFLV